MTMRISKEDKIDQNQENFRENLSSLLKSLCPKVKSKNGWKPKSAPTAHPTKPPWPVKLELFIHLWKWVSIFNQSDLDFMNYFFL